MGLLMKLFNTGVQERTWTVAVLRINYAYSSIIWQSFSQASGIFFVKKNVYYNTVEVICKKPYVQKQMLEVFDDWNILMTGTLSV